MTISPLKRHWSTLSRCVLAHIKLITILLLSITCASSYAQNSDAFPKESTSFPKASDASDFLNGGSSDNTASGLPAEFLQENVPTSTALTPKESGKAEDAKEKPIPLFAGEVRKSFDPDDFMNKVGVGAVLNSGDKASAPGQDLLLAVRLFHAKGWHTHTHAPKWPTDDFQPIATVIEVSADNPAIEVHTKHTQWPKPELIKVNFTGSPIDYEVYGHEATLIIPISIKQTLAPGSYQLNITYSFQACNDVTCLPPVMGETLTLPLKITATTTEADKNEKLTQLFASFDATTWASIKAGQTPATLKESEPKKAATTFASELQSWSWLILVAVVGGLLLNFTPCVLPVLPIKILSLTRSFESKDAENPKHLKIHLFTHAAVMCAGITGFWLLIAMLMTVLQQFDTVNELFTYGEFVIGVGIVMLIMGIGMMGLFTISLPQWTYQFNPLGGKNKEGEDKGVSMGGSFLYGIMTAVLATPCAGPFMGSAIATSTQMSQLMTIMVFLAIGIGMSIPYFFLSLFPKLVDHLPRAGRGSELLKQVMGLLILAGAAFFVGSGINTMTHDGTNAPSKLYWWVVALLIAFSGVWLIYQALKYKIGKGGGSAGSVIGLLLIAGGIWIGMSLGITRKSLWTYYTPEVLAQAKQDGQVMVIDFTADWCLNCKVLEQTVLSQDKVTKVLKADHVTAIKVDLTSQNNKNGYKLLKELNHATIPLIAVLKPDGQPQARMDFFTAEQLLAEIEKAKVQ